MKKTAVAETVYSKPPLDHIAFWEGLGFFLMILLIWVDVLYGLSSLFFGKGEPRDWMSACALTAVTIVVGFVTVGNTYLQHKRELSGLFAICSYCRKIKVNEEAWSQIEHFISEKTLANFTHVICPECEPRVWAEMEKDVEALREGKISPESAE